MEVTEKRRITGIEDLINDVTMEILLLLPLNSIIQCYDVCKRWRSLISGSPFFLTHTVNVATTSHHEFMCLKKGQGKMQSSELDFSVGFPTRQCYDYTLHITSCNGLLFSYHFMSESANLGECYISNPWTKECVRLPNPSMLCDDSVFGLAFENNSSNSSSNNNVALYKVVMAYRVGRPYLTGEALHKFEIYSSKKRRWRRLGRASRPHLCWHRLDENAVYFNRVLYWQCRCSTHALMFNMDTKTSDYLDLPQKNEAFSLSGSVLKECNGQLHCIQIFYDCLRLYVLQTSTTSGGWLMLHNADLKGALERDLGTFPLLIGNRLLLSMKPIDMSCQGDDKVLLLEDSKRNIVSYDVKKDVFETVNTGYISPLKFFRYTPTKASISRRQGEISKQFEKLSNYARKLLGRWKLAS